MRPATHEEWMQRCLALAARGAGQVSPNPMVGSVVVGADGVRLGEGWHAVYGGAHAERNALDAACVAHPETALRAATLYVNLEPCSHYGKTPPCADYVLEHGVPRVVVGMRDPFPLVAGRGLDRLREAGVEVVEGVLEEACRRFNEAFVHHVRTHRPLVTLKVAQSLDGRVATASGDSRWVTGPAARQRVHQWRAELDAVLIGAGTARHDDPALTVRHVDGRQPVRVVLDRTGSLSPHLQLFADRHVTHTLAVVGPHAAPAYAPRLEQAGGRLWRVPERDGHLDLGALLDRLGREGGLGERPLQSVLVEAGPGLATALLHQDLVDRLIVFVAPKLVGTGMPAVRALGVERMAEARRFVTHTWESVEGDLLFRGYLRAV